MCFFSWISIRPGFSWIFFFGKLFRKEFPPPSWTIIFNSKKDSAKVPPAAVHRFHDDGRSSQVKKSKLTRPKKKKKFVYCAIEWRTDRTIYFLPRLFVRLIQNCPETIFSTFFLLAGKKQIRVKGGGTKNRQHSNRVVFFPNWPRVKRTVAVSFPF